MLNFIVDEELCIHCGKCVADCPTMCIRMEKGSFPTISEEEKCLRCQHCLAVCPEGAVSILDVKPEDSLTLKYSLPTAQSMEVLIKGRRSTRSYKKQALDQKTLNSLLETAWHAPTGANAQSVLFTATMTAELTEDLRTQVYGKVGELLDGTNPDDDTIQLQYLRMAHNAYDEHGIDVIFRGAPHVLIASAPKTAPTPKEDTIIALTTFDLLAPTVGVGALWNGILTWCLSDFFPELTAKLNVPEDHLIGYCMVFGRPAVQYQCTVQRQPAGLNLVESL